MKALSHQDILALNGAIGEIYSPRDMESFYRSAFSAILNLIPSELCSCANAIIHPARFLKLTTSSQQHDDVSSKLLPAFNAHLHEHPLVPHCFSGEVIKTTDYVSTKQFKATAIHNEYYRHLEVEAQICFSIPVSRDKVELFALSRKNIDFSERDKLLLTLLRPHLINALRNVTEFERVTLERDLLQKRAEATRQGAILFQSDGAVVCISPFAEEMLERYFGAVVVEGDALPERLLQWFETEIDPFARPFENGESLKDIPLKTRAAGGHSKRVERQLLTVEKEGNCLEIQFFNDFTSADYMLFLVERDPFLLVQNLAAYCLSHRETEVLMLLSKGKTNVEIAVILGMRKRTAEKHMEHIFAKLGVETRSAALAVLRKESYPF